MKTKVIVINGREYPLIRYHQEWVFPVISFYEFGLENPVAFMLYNLEEESSFGCYTHVTVNLPDCKRGTGCQFIDTNNNGNNILDWLEENNFGKRTGRFGESGFCEYPEFDFYKGKKFHEYKILNEHFQQINYLFT